MSCVMDFKRAYKTLAETTLHLMKRVPEGNEDFKPSAGEFMNMGQLMHHLGECQQFLRMILEGTLREMDKNFIEHMSNLPSASREEAIRRFTEEYSKSMRMLEDMTEEEFHRKVYYFWTVDDEPMPFISHNIIEHNTSHKYQLFIYLKLMGIADMDSFALAAEDNKPKDEILKMYEIAHKAYDEKHGIKS